MNITKISVKHPDFINNDNIFFVDNKKIMMDCLQVFINGPCESVYGLDKRYADFLIFWVLSASEVQPIRTKINYTPMKKRILIDRKTIMSNTGKLPKDMDNVCCIIDENGKETKCMGFQILGPSRIVHNSDNEKYTVWIETDSEIKIMEKTN